MHCNHKKKKKNATAVRFKTSQHVQPNNHKGSTAEKYKEKQLNNSVVIGTKIYFGIKIMQKIHFYGQNEIFLKKIYCQLMDAHQCMGC